MDWTDTPGEARFRNQVRELIDSHLPSRYRELAERGGPGERVWEFDRKSEDEAARTAAIEWHRALGEQQWVAAHWPREYGGGGLSPVEQFILNEELSAAGAPAVGGSGVSTLGPTLIVHGTPEQRERYLPPILAGNVAWAQGYSEPGAGSDLGGLATRAVRDGDDFVISGQKIWTSGAHTADALFALVRTDPAAPKHKDISFVLIDDIKSPGISIRPLLDLGGRHYFNEVFLDAVRVPAANVVGDVDRGWHVAMTLLDFERSSIGGAVGARRNLARLLKTLREHRAMGDRMNPSPVRHELAQRHIEASVMYQFSRQVISIQTRGRIPNYEASMAKLYSSELAQRLAQTGIRAFGLHGNLINSGYDESPARSYLGTVPATIRGGTSEVQRNVIATRGLGLPRS